MYEETRETRIVWMYVQIWFNDNDLYLVFHMF